MNEEMKDPIILPSGEDLKKPMRHRDPRKGRLLLLALGGIVVLAALVIGVTKLAQAIGEYVELNTDHTVHLTDTTADKVQRIEIQGRTAVTITRRDGQSVDAEAFKAAFQAINVVPVNGFTSAEEVAEAPAVLTLTYVFSGEEEPYTVTYLDSSINNYALRKNDSVSVTVSKEACADMLAQLRALLA